MKSLKLTRRAFNAGTVAVAALAAVGGRTAASADQKVIKIGMTLPLTGADADDATLIKNGAMMAIDEANAAGGVAGYKIVPVIYDNGTATAGQYDPAQAATNTKKLIADPLVVANVGPEMSGVGISSVAGRHQIRSPHQKQRDGNPLGGVERPSP